MSPTPVPPSEEKRRVADSTGYDVLMTGFFFFFQTSLFKKKKEKKELYNHLDTKRRFRGPVEVSRTLRGILKSCRDARMNVQIHISMAGNSRFYVFFFLWMWCFVNRLWTFNPAERGHFHLSSVSFSHNSIKISKCDYKPAWEVWRMRDVNTD